METPHEEKSKNIINGIEEIQEKLKSTQLILNEGKFDEAIESYRICCEKAYYIINAIFK